MTIQRSAERGTPGPTTAAQPQARGIRGAWLDPNLSAALGLAMFPGLEHRELSGGFGFSAISAPTAVFAGLPTVELRLREARAGDLPLPLRDEDDAEERPPHAFVRETTVRLLRDDAGRIDLDRVEVGLLGGVWVRSRPNLGEPFELALGVGRREEAWVWRNLEHVQWRLFSPFGLFPIGLSNTDQDDDGRVKGQASALFGLGTEVLWRPAGPLLAHARVTAEGRSARRFANTTTNNVRHEGTLVAEAGLGARTSERNAVLLVAWAEAVAQVDPWDGGDTRLAVDRRWAAGGLRLMWRWYDSGHSAKPADIERLLERLGDEIDGPVDLPPPPAEPAPPTLPPPPAPPDEGPLPPPPTRPGPSPD